MSERVAWYFVISMETYFSVYYGQFQRLLFYIQFAVVFLLYFQGFICGVREGESQLMAFLVERVSISFKSRYRFICLDFRRQWVQSWLFFSFGQWEFLLGLKWKRKRYQSFFLYFQRFQGFCIMIFEFLGYDIFVFQVIVFQRFRRKSLGKGGLRQDRGFGIFVRGVFRFFRKKSGYISLFFIVNFLDL